MSEAFRSAVAFRADICDTVNQLKQRFTRPLPNGATVYITGGDTLYRLFKNLGNGFDALGSVIVVPSDGSSNRWVQESDRGASPWSSIEIALASVDVVPNSPNAWRGLGTTAGSFGGGSNVFQVDAASSVMTYSGVTRLMTLAYDVTVLNGTGGDIHAETAISHNGDVPADSTSDFRGAGQQGVTLPAGFRAVLSGKRSVTLADGQTVRLMLRNVAGSGNLTVEYFSMSFDPN